MSKKEALGSIPTFENVAKATEELDLFKEEPKKKDNEKDKIKQMKKEMLEKAKKEKEELNKQAKNPLTEDIEKVIEAEPTEEKTKKAEKPSTKKGIRAGYKRQTFVIKDEYLEIIQALCYANDIKQVDLLENFIEAGLDAMKKDLIEKSLNKYRKEEQKDKKDKQEEAKKNIAKLFK